MKNDSLLNNQYRQIFELAKNYEHGQRAVKNAESVESSTSGKTEDDKDSMPASNRKHAPLLV